MNIRKKSILLSVLVPSILILLLAAGLFFSQFQKDVGNARSLLLSNSTNIQNQIAAELLVSFELLRNVAANPLTVRVAQRMDQVPNGVDNDDFGGLSEFRTFTDLMARTSAHTNADLVYLAGINSRGIILSADTQLGDTFDVRQRDYYQLALAKPGTTVISQPRVSAQETAEPLIVVTVALAVVNDLGRPVGVVSLNYSFNRITDIVRELMAEFDVLITLYDTVGGVVLGTETNEGFVFYDPENPITVLDWVQSLGFAGDAAQIKTDEISNLDYSYLEGNTPLGPSMIETMKIPNTRWALAVIDSRNAVVAEVIGSILPPLAIFMGVFLVGQFAVFLLYLRLLINPMVGLGKNLSQLALADADLTIQIPQGGKDEIGLVASSFNTFVAKLRSLMQEVKIAIEGTETIKQNISSATEETTSAVEEISANLQSIGNQMKVLDDNIRENVTVIEQITQNISSVDSQILNQSSMVEQSTAAITQMIASLESVNQVAQTKGKATRNLSEVAEDGKVRIQKTAENFGQVVQQINLVQEMATAINAIAAQTNLLSMNAAIEAAHAGDAGRGFAVVAEEIRNLADSAGNSSKKITALIRDITKAVGITDEEVRRTSAAFESISREVGDTVNAFAEIENAVAELNEGGRQILESTNQINEVTIQIRSGSQEMKTGTDLMLNSSTSIKDISERVSQGMAESTTGVQEIVEAMQQVLGLTVELNTIVGQLKNNFERFKT
ncbi:MAG: HAMP domain-containing protein [Spirochaetales bacterium]|nr:HAMP domain-containing protein [Spirochaetales bacterium]